MNLIGLIEPTDARWIARSRWSIGGETLDRRYADYHAYKAHLGPLCAKRLRLQAGWARCETLPGRYDFDWLEAIVDDAISQGVQPWIELSYGNPIYPGGGTAALAGGIPHSAEALVAWDAWVAALVERFADRVRQWEIWNEPDISRLFDHQQFAAFYARTAEQVRRVQPDAFIIAMGLARPDDVKYIDAIVAACGGTQWIDAVSYHGYRRRPEDVADAVATLRQAITRIDRRIELWQGETGAPSGPADQCVGALSDVDWSELTQAKWNLRRMAFELSTDAAVISVFQISDMHYATGDHFSGYNSKGLVQTSPDNRVVKIKQAWAAYRHFAAVFSGDLTVERSARADVRALVSNRAVAGAMAMVCRRGGRTAGAVWLASELPTESEAHVEVELTLHGCEFEQPLWIEPISGQVFAPDTDNVRTGEGRTVLRRARLWDSPMVIADAAWLDDLANEGVLAVGGWSDATADRRAE